MKRRLGPVARAIWWCWGPARWLVPAALAVWAGPVSHAQDETTEFGMGFVREPEEAYKAFPTTGRFRAFLPAEVDLSSSFPTPGSQGAQGSCAAWATGYALRGFFERAGKAPEELSSAPPTTFSPAFIYNRLHAGGDCGGTAISTALEFLKREGVAPMASFPYSAADCRRQPDAEVSALAARYRIRSWRAIESGRLDDAKGQLARGVPVVFGMDVSRSFRELRGDAIYNDTESPRIGGHAMVMVGYSESRQAFKVMNSWGTRWGDGGFGWVSYQAMRALSDRQFVADAVAAGPAPAPVAVAPAAPRPPAPPSPVVAPPPAPAVVVQPPPPPLPPPAPAIVVQPPPPPAPVVAPPVPAPAPAVVVQPPPPAPVPVVAPPVPAPAPAIVVQPPPPAPVPVVAPPVPAPAPAIVVQPPPPAPAPVVAPPVPAPAPAIVVQPPPPAPAPVVAPPVPAPAPAIVVQPPPPAPAPVVAPPVPAPAPTVVVRPPSPPPAPPAPAVVVQPPPPAPVVAPPPPPPVVVAVAPPPQRPPLPSVAATASAVSSRVQRAQCARMESSLLPDRTVRLSGFIGDAAELDTLRTGLLGLPGVARVDASVQLRPWPQCEFILNFEDALSNRSGLQVRLIGGVPASGVDAQLRAGDSMSVEVTTPSYPSYVYVSYLQAAGEVVHLSWPAGRFPRATPPNTRLVFGGGANGQPVYRMGPPFGNEMVVVIASASPLFDRPLPDTADDREYLSSFRRAFALQPRTGGARTVSAAFATLRTQEK